MFTIKDYSIHVFKQQRNERFMEFSFRFVLFFVHKKFTTTYMKEEKNEWNWINNNVFICCFYIADDVQIQIQIHRLKRTLRKLYIMCHHKIHKPVTFHQGKTSIACCSFSFYKLQANQRHKLLAICLFFISLTLSFSLPLSLSIYAFSFLCSATVFDL